MIVPGSAFIPYFVPPAGGGVSGNGSVLEFADIATGQGRKGHVGTGAVTEAGDIAVGEGVVECTPIYAGKTKAVGDTLGNWANASYGDSAGDWYVQQFTNWNTNANPEMKEWKFRRGSPWAPELVQTIASVPVGQTGSTGAYVIGLDADVRMMAAPGLDGTVPCVALYNVATEQSWKIKIPAGIYPITYNAAIRGSDLFASTFDDGGPDHQRIMYANVGVDATFTMLTMPFNCGGGSPQIIRASEQSIYMLAVRSSDIKQFILKYDRSTQDYVGAMETTAHVGNTFFVLGEDDFLFGIASTGLYRCRVFAATMAEEATGISTVATDIGTEDGVEAGTNISDMFSSGTGFYHSSAKLAADMLTGYSSFPGASGGSPTAGWWDC